MINHLIKINQITVYNINNLSLIYYIFILNINIIISTLNPFLSIRTDFIPTVLTHVEFTFPIMFFISTFHLSITFSTTT